MPSICSVQGSMSIHNKQEVWVGANSDGMIHGIVFLHGWS